MKITKIINPNQFTKFPLSEAGEEYELDYEIESLPPLEDEEEDEE